MNRTNFALLIVSVIFLLFGIIFSLMTYKAENKKTYSFNNMFPYELSPFPINKRNIYGKISFLISLLSLVVFFIIYQNDMPEQLKLSASLVGIRTSIMVLGIVGVISIFCTFFISMVYIKFHLLMDYLLFTFSFLFALMIGIMNVLVYNEIHSLYYLIFAVISFLISVFLFILIVNPKLKDWAKLEAKTEKDGTLVYVRPKVFILAISEWIFIFVFYFSSIILLISLIYIR